MRILIVSLAVAMLAGVFQLANIGGQGRASARQPRFQRVKTGMGVCTRLIF